MWGAKQGPWRTLAKLHIMPVGLRGVWDVCSVSQPRHIAITPRPGVSRTGPLDFAVASRVTKGRESGHESSPRDRLCSRTAEPQNSTRDVHSMMTNPQKPTPNTPPSTDWRDWLRLVAATTGAVAQVGRFVLDLIRR